MDKQMQDEGKEQTILEIPYSVLPEGCESGHTITLTGVVTYEDGAEMASFSVESAKKASGKSREPSEADAADYAKRLDAEAGYEGAEEGIMIP